MFHNSQNPYYRNPLGAVATKTTVRLALDVDEQITLKEHSNEHNELFWQAGLVEGSKIKSVKLHTWQECCGASYYTMIPASWDSKHYFIDLPMPEEGCLVWYYFVVEFIDGRIVYYGNNQEQWGGIGQMQDNPPPSYQITVFKAGAKTPDWFKHAVMYQIFPDRFYRSGTKLAQKKQAVFHCDWNDPPMYYMDKATGQIIAYDYFGGNIQGVREKLSYLKDLGISVIYFNPIFQSTANHHYDTADYRNVDPMFGTNEEFAQLCAEAERLGIKIILDGVFSHTGSDSIYFNQNGNFDNLGASQSKDSPYYEWYDFETYPDKYKCWWGFTTMPNVKETTPSYMDFIIRGEDSVLDFWLDKGISGWRLDVIDELPPKFTRCFYQKLKRKNPEAVLIGEVWEDASNKIAYDVHREYLCGYEMDSAMNYPLRTMMLDFILGRKSAEQTHLAIAHQQENYPCENLYAMMNLLGSHDVERILTVLGEAIDSDKMSATEKAAYRLPDDQLRLGLARLKLAVAWQMTLPGVPSVYYGDEIGMQGYKDPHNRASYKWEQADVNLRHYFTRLISLRNQRAVLQTGFYEPAYAQDDVLAYWRTTKLGKDRFGKDLTDDCVLVVLNRHQSKKITVEIDVHGFSAYGLHELSGMYPDVAISDNKAHIILEPLSAMVFEPMKSKETYHRKAGIILHPTSLPSAFGIGELGTSAYAFIDWLVEAKQQLWQVLPLNPVGYGASPYQSPSAFAGNPMLISLEKLVEQGLLSEADIQKAKVEDLHKIDFASVELMKEALLRKAFGNFVADADYTAFCKEHGYWLEDFAIFSAIKLQYEGKPWYEWHEQIKQHQPEAVAASKIALASEIAYAKFKQYIFWRQWEALHQYAKAHGIQIIGDLPIFPSHDSADVWVHQNLFNLNPDGTLKTAAGVPPDYFSEDGQLWGNPHYLWDIMQRDDYAWWQQRILTALKLVDIIRVDHFRGFEAYWEVDGQAKTARVGRWVKGPGRDFFDKIRQHLGDVPIIAEDLGLITPEVEALKTVCKLPGMKVLHFELYPNQYHKMNVACCKNSVIYTGTHDNNTTVGWLQQDISAEDKAILSELLQVSIEDNQKMAQKLMEIAYASEAKYAIVPLQDVLGLDGSARMNLPGTVGNNWHWRALASDLTKTRAEYLAQLALKYQR